jgi:hypothetical protein
MNPTVRIPNAYSGVLNHCLPGFTTETQSHREILEPDNELTRRVIGCAIEVHRTLGPGLLEAVYEACLCHEVAQAGMEFVRQRRLPVVYRSIRSNAT